MTEPTEKQVKYAEKLGIDNPSQYNKQALSAKIDEAQGRKSTAPSVKVESQITPRHEVTIQRVEKPHSFEFGKPGKRHKIHYGAIDELKAHYNALKEAGFIDVEDEVEVIKP